MAERPSEELCGSEAAESQPEAVPAAAQQPPPGSPPGRKQYAVIVPPTQESMMQVITLPRYFPAKSSGKHCFEVEDDMAAGVVRFWPFCSDCHEDCDANLRKVISWGHRSPNRLTSCHLRFPALLPAAGTETAVVLFPATTATACAQRSKLVAFKTDAVRHYVIQR